MNKRDFVSKALKQVNQALAKKERIKPFVKSSHYERTVMVLELVHWGLTKLDKKLNLSPSEPSTTTQEKETE